MVDISVIISTFNRSLLLKKSIDSVLAQTYQNFELIVIDDGSTDETKSMVKEYGDKLRYIYQENRGSANARNRGIKESMASVIAFLDSDDWWAKEKLEVQFKAMQEQPDYLISHTQEIWYKNGKLLNQKIKHKKYGGFIFDKCLSICAVGMSTIMVRRRLFDEAGLFDDLLPCCEDYDLWLRVSAKHPFLLIDKPLTLKAGGRSDQLSCKFARGMDKFRISSLESLLVGNDLNEQQRNLVIQELDRKCRIYANGCIKHGREKEGQFYFDLVRKFKCSK